MTPITFERTISATLLTELAKPMFYPVVMAWVDWPGGAVAGHTGLGDIVHDGRTFKGLGQFASVSVSGEAAGTAPQEIAIGVAGVIEDLIEDAAEDVEGADVAVYFGAVTNPGGNVLVGAPQKTAGLVVASDLDTGEPRLVLGADTGPRARAHASIRHSGEDQQRRHPGDTFFDRCAHARPWSKKVKWPATT